MSSEDPRTRQLAISSLEQRHCTTYRYPRCELLEPDEEDSVYKPENAAERYKPEALIPNRAVKAHCSWGTPEAGEWSYFTLDRVDRYHPEHVDRPTTADDDYQSFLADMDWARSRAGSTILDMVTATDGESEDHKILVIRRLTKHFACGTLSMVSSIETYELDPTRFIGCEPEDDTSGLHKTIRELLLRTTDRAVKHFQHCLEPGADPFDGWKPMREPDATDVECALRAATTPTDLLNLQDTQCVICADEMDQAVTLPCNPKHSFCRSCLVPYICKKVAQCNEKVECPLCRAPFLWYDAIEPLQYGLSATGLYKPDARYDAWENFERSCADLDGFIADDHLDHIIFTEPGPLLGAWDNLLLGCALEPASSTPLHLQPVHAPEMRRARSVVAATLKDLHACTQEYIIKGLYRVLREAVMAAFWVDVIPSGMTTCLTLQELAESQGRPVNYLLRPGLEAFLERLLSRTLTMVYYRHCDQDACVEAAAARGPGSLLWHFHGGREFYSDGIEAPPMPRDYSGI